MLQILIVEDQPGLQDILKETFMSLGFPTHAVATAKEALAYFRKYEPQILYIDINLPDRDGIDLLKEMKSINSKIVPIVLSGEDDPTNRERAKAAGAVQFISKPFYTDTIRTALFHNLKHLSLAEPSKKPLILIADDEEDITEALKRIIKRQFDAEVMTASDGGEATDILKSHEVDVAFMDVRMPVKNGTTVISEHKHTNTTFIVITGDLSTDMLQELKRLGIKNYFNKPIHDKAPILEHLKAILIAKNKYKTKV